jgi:hypothetical protein
MKGRKKNRKEMAVRETVRVLCERARSYDLHRAEFTGCVFLAAVLRNRGVAADNVLCVTETESKYVLALRIVQDDCTVIVLDVYSLLNDEPARVLKEASDEVKTKLRPPSPLVRAMAVVCDALTLDPTELIEKLYGSKGTVTNMHAQAAWKRLASETKMK